MKVDETTEVKIISKKGNNIEIILIEDTLKGKVYTTKHLIYWPASYDDGLARVTLGHSYYPNIHNPRVVSGNPGWYDTLGNRYNLK